MKNTFSLIAFCSFFIGNQVSASFNDVSQDHPNFEAINYVQSQGIVQGYEDGSYKPDKEVNRVELLKILLEATGKKDLEFKCRRRNFSDVDWNAWYGNYLHTAHCNNVVAGYPDGTFKPGNSINFAEGAKIIVNTFGWPQETSSDLWFESFVRILEEKRAIPTSIQRFDQPLTRGQMAEIIFRVSTGTTDKPSQSFKVIEEKSQEPKTETPLPEIKNPNTFEIDPNFESDIMKAIEPLGFLEGTMIKGLKDLSQTRVKKEKDYLIRQQGNFYAFIKKENNTVKHIILLIKGDIEPKAPSTFWDQAKGSKLTDTILYHVDQDSSQSNIPADALPFELSKVIKKTYGGTIDLKSGEHAMAEITLDGNLGSVVESMNYPTDNLIANIGSENPAFNGQTGINAGVEASKKKGDPLDALKPTKYIEVMHRGIWKDPIGMKGMTITDPIVYYDNGNNFGWWGNGQFEDNAFVTFYKGPLLKSKDPRDYLEAQIGFGAEEMTVAQYIKLVTTYNTRLPNSSQLFLGEANQVQEASTNALFAGIDTLPLDILSITNDKLKNKSFKSGDPLPKPEVFNTVVLGPLATSRYGSNGPLVRVAGNTKFLGETFGKIDLTIDSQRASGEASGNLGIHLGSIGPQDLGKIGGNAKLNIEATDQSQRMTLSGNFEAGPLGGRGVSINLKQNQFDFKNAASCSFPFQVKAIANIQHIKTLTIKDVMFKPTTVLPDPLELASCPEDIFFAIKNGVTYAFNGTVKLAEFANSFLPENDVTRLGIDGLKLAGGTMIAAPEEMLNLAKQVPGVGEFTDLGNKLKDEAAKKAAEAAAEAKRQAELAAKEAAEAAKRAAEEAARAAEKAAAEAAKQAEKAINEGINQLNNFVSDPGGTIKSVGGAISSVGNAIGGFFGGGGSSIPGFGWHGPYLPIKAIDVSVAHNLSSQKSIQAWFISDTGYPLQLQDIGGWRFYFWYKNNGLPSNFPGFIRIDADKNGNAAAIDRKGRLWTYNGTWRMTDTYALDVGIGGGYIWITSTQPQWGSYKIYRAPYQAGKTSFNWQYMHGAATKIDVGRDGRAWVINKAFEVWEWKNNTWYNRDGRAIDITVSASNRAWVISAADYNKNSGGGRVYTYETCHWNALLNRCQRHIPARWEATAGFADTIGAGYGRFVFVVNHQNNIYAGTGRE